MPVPGQKNRKLRSDKRPAHSHGRFPQEDPARQGAVHKREVKSEEDFPEKKKAKDS